MFVSVADRAKAEKPFKVIKHFYRRVSVYGLGFSNILASSFTEETLIPYTYFSYKMLISDSLLN